MSGLIINKALYGVGVTNQQNIVDVTNQVQNIANEQGGSVVAFKISFETFRIADPQPGIKKGFTVEYVSQAGNPKMVRGGTDGETITLAGEDSLEIISAVYGGPKNGFDLTDKLARYFSDPAAPALTVNEDFINKFCDYDPASGIQKSLSITASSQGNIGYLICVDGNTISRQNSGNIATLVVS